MKRSAESNSAAAKNREDEIHQILEILHKWGIHTLGQLVRLDKEQLRARLGPEAVRMWERANGQSNRPLKLVRQPESFEESFEFENEIATAEPLLFMLRRFLEQLSFRLSAIYLVTKELRLQITFSNKQHYERCFKIPQPTNDVDLLFQMLHTNLENFKSEYPITAFSLEAKPTKASQQQFGLFEIPLRDPNQLYETLARLIALLGNDRVGTPVLEETDRSIFLGGWRVRCPQRRASRCAEDSAHYNGVATISTGRICIRFSIRKYSCSPSKREGQRQSCTAKRSLSRIRELV